ncbi:HAAS signaling domain-containing protein [Kribbella sp. NPDC051620]|uniref:HAAS signaling domain-containing protein n=1 Tax=Kribbella sp. NPDC051620 TaxID=3364120 RepID=UPI00379190D1
MNVQNDADRLVDDYLRRLTKEAEPLPEARRTDLIAEVTAHIAEARAEGAVTEAEIRDMLARLGTPEEIVLAATDGLVLVDRQPRFRSRDVAALLLLTVGGFVFLFGWVIGVVLLWTSDRWTRNEKWLGTLIWPFGYAFTGFLLKAYIPIDMPSWLAWIGWTFIFVTQTATTSMLVRNARPRRG